MFSFHKTPQKHTFPLDYKSLQCTQHCLYNCARLKLAESSNLSGTVLGWQTSQLHCLGLVSHVVLLASGELCTCPCTLVGSRPDWEAQQWFSRPQSEVVLIWDSGPKIAPLWSPLGFLELFTPSLVGQRGMLQWWNEGSEAVQRALHLGDSVLVHLHEHMHAYLYAHRHSCTHYCGFNSY